MGMKAGDLTNGSVGSVAGWRPAGLLSQILPSDSTLSAYLGDFDRVGLLERLVRLVRGDDLSVGTIIGINGGGCATTITGGV